MLNYCNLNPLISPPDISLKDKDLNKEFNVVGSFNPAVAKYNDKYMLLVRIAIKKSDSNGKAIAHIWKDGINTDLQFSPSSNVDLSDCRVIKTKDTSYLTSVSIFGLYYSADGQKFEFIRFIFPEGQYEEYGIEDPRITKIGDVYYITYSGVSSAGICGRLMKTKDFNAFERVGNIFGPDDKDIAYFPEAINGKYYVLHRPCLSDFAKPEIWIAEGLDLEHFGNHKLLLNTRLGSWDSTRVGACMAPIKLDDGWLLLYHGANVNNYYSIGAALLDLNEPWIVKKRTIKPIIVPNNEYDINGFFNNVVFPCGMIRDDDILHIYYGGADKYVCLVDISIKYIRGYLEDEK